MGPNYGAVFHGRSFPLIGARWPLGRAVSYRSARDYARRHVTRPPGELLASRARRPRPPRARAARGRSKRAAKRSHSRPRLAADPHRSTAPEPASSVVLALASAPHSRARARALASGYEKGHIGRAETGSGVVPTFRALFPRLGTRFHSKIRDLRGPFPCSQGFEPTRAMCARARTFARAHTYGDNHLPWERGYKASNALKSLGKSVPELGYRLGNVGTDSGRSCGRARGVRASRQLATAGGI
jgi:hypothetical protein